MKRAACAKPESAQTLPLGVVAEQPLDGRRHRTRILGVEEEGRAAGDFRERPASRRRHGHASRHRLEHGKTEALVQGREDEAGRERVQALHVLVRNPIQEPRVVGEAECGRACAQLLFMARRVPGEHEQRPALGRDQRERLEQPHEVLVRPLGRDRERDGSRPEAEASAQAGLGGGLDACVHRAPAE